MLPWLVLLVVTKRTSAFFLTDFRTNDLDPPGVESDNDPRLQPLIPQLTCPLVFNHVPNINATCVDTIDCRPGEICCPFGRFRFCLTGVQHNDVKHKPLLGVPRYCPTTEPLQEILPVKNCTKDLDCEPRICCPDGNISYCRTAVPRFQPRTSQAVRVAYLQCSPPPPPSLDLFPKPCKYSFDCFPNICCQEKGKKVCRPAKRSILRLLAAFNLN